MAKSQGASIQIWIYLTGYWVRYSLIGLVYFQLPKQKPKVFVKIRWYHQTKTKNTKVWNHHQDMNQIWYFTDRNSYIWCIHCLWTSIAISKSNTTTQIIEVLWFFKSKQFKHHLISGQTKLVLHGTPLGPRFIQLSGLIQTFFFSGEYGNTRIPKDWTYQVGVSWIRVESDLTTGKGPHLQWRQSF